MNKAVTFTKIGRRTDSVASPMVEDAEQLPKQEEQQSVAEIVKKRIRTNTNQSNNSRASSIQSRQSLASFMSNPRKSRTRKKTTVPMNEDRPSIDNNQKSLAQIGRLIRSTTLVKLFLEKLGYNSVYRTPVYYDPLQKQEDDESHGICLDITVPQFIINTVLAVKVVYSLLFAFFFPLNLLYRSLQYSPLLLSLKVVGMILSASDLVAQWTVYSKGKGRKARIYLQCGILLTLTLSILLTSLGQSAGGFFMGAMFLNLSSYMNAITELEGQFLTLSYEEKYWNLFKVIAMNLFVCHILACVLIAISLINPSNNWMTDKQIDTLPWNQQYIWSYYFGTTIILTIGFGDLHPKNTTEAAFTIVISFFACLFFGYNINCVGNLINAIRQEELAKNDKLRVLDSLVKRNSVSKQIRHELREYITEEAKINQTSNHAEEKQLLKELPETLRSNYLKEANRKVFSHFQSFLPFTFNTIERLSLKIQAKVCHPNQLIKGPRSPASLMILQSGQVSFVPRTSYSSSLRNAIIERISPTKHRQFPLICVDFLNHTSNKYNIRSLSYAIVYEMTKMEIEECLRQTRDDYELYRQKLDQCDFRLNPNGLKECQFCPNRNHTLFECPKLHYMPFRTVVSLKNQRSENSQKQQRKQFIREKNIFGDVVVQESKARKRTNLDRQYSGSIGPQLLVLPPNMMDKRRNSSYHDTMKAISQIREELVQLRATSSPKDFVFNMWDLPEVDEITNYKYYFPRYNAEILERELAKDTLITNISNMKIITKKFL